MSKETIRKAQQAQLTIMKSIHELCVDKKLTYYIIGGTALGAIRHNGFIPWDPDIDIAMPRKDYELFIYNYSKGLEPRFSCLNYKNTHNHESPHALVVLNGSRLMNQHDSCNGIVDRKVYVDIFPLDSAPEDKGLQAKQASKIKRLQKLKYYRISTIYDTNTAFQRFSKQAVRLLLSFISIDRLNKRLDDTFKTYSEAEATPSLLCSMASHYSYKKQCMPQTVYGIPQLIQFEDVQLYGPQQIEDYLKRIYGDYMKLPSEEEQNKWYNYLDDIDIIIEE